MKNNDEKLASFFFDLKNIEDYKTTLDGLDKFYNECVEILDRKKFSNINIQDEKGNTYLHYVVKDSNWNWAIRLMELGADPTIKNNEGRNVFMVAPINGGALALWAKIGKQGFSNFNTWENISKLYCFNAKQKFFDYFLKDNLVTFETNGEINNFLRRNGIKSDHNEIALMTNTGYQLKRDAYAWYQNNYDVKDIDNNNHFFVYSLIQKVFWINRSESIIDFLSKRKITQTEKVVDTIVDIIRESQKKGAKQSKNLAEAVIKFMVENNFDLNKEFEKGVRLTTIQKEIESSPITFQILLDSSLKKNDKKIKANKI